MSKNAPFVPVPEHAERLRDARLDSLDACFSFTGGEVVKSAIVGRDVLRFEASGVTYFLKRVIGKGWRDVLVEHRATEKLLAAGLPVPQPAAMGAEPGRAAMITVGLPCVTNLEDLLLKEEVSPERLRRLGERIAALARALHGAGACHRDFYAGHLPLDEEDNVFLVDLGRAELRKRVPRRRVVKDLAALHFSLPARVAGTRARLRFLFDYFERKMTKPRMRRWIRAIEWKSARMRRHSEHKLARGEPNVHVND